MLLMRKETRMWIAVNLCAYVPYLAAAWLVIEFVATNTSYLNVFLMLLGVRAIYGLIDLLGGILAWHLILKRNAVNKLIELFQLNKFPQRKYSYDSADTYIFRLAEPDFPNQISKIVTDKAKEIEQDRYRLSQQGMLAEARFNKAIEIAVNKFAPKNQAIDM